MTTDLNTNNRIVILDDHTANRIAAGEVVERPVSVVKELVENSIDSGASQITITLEDGGKNLIKITDNGCGMTREDAVMSLQRHATSKIRDANDLDEIITLGFRGEALPSIASVSVMEMITKCESESCGVRLEITAGTIDNLESVGAPQGTTISIKNMFFNTPARLKFLKTSQTELAHITEIISQFAIAYPSIYFKLIHGDKEILSSPGTGIHLNSIVQVLGNDIARHLIPISFETGVMKVFGFAANPGLNKMNRRSQIIFVNGRPIKNRTISHAIDEGYKGLIQHGRYPVAIIFIELSPDLVDVNVHPSKTEVKFSSEREIHSAVHRAINEALRSGAGAQTIMAEPSRPVMPLKLRPDEIHPKLNLNNDTTHEVSIDQFREALQQRRQEALSETSDNNDPYSWKSGEGVPMEESPIPEASFEAARTVALRSVNIIGQARNTYIIAQCDDGVLIIDQHVAHERVLYDRMVKAHDENGIAIQGLMIPTTLSLSSREAAIVSHRIDQIRKAGFDIEAFGTNTYVMRGAPASLSPEKTESVLREMIDELLEISVTKHLMVRPDQVLITASCKMAVKAGDPLSMAEMKRLVDDLLLCDNPFTCPHSRPIIVSLSNWELDRKFHRI